MQTMVPRVNSPAILFIIPFTFPPLPSSRSQVKTCISFASFCADLSPLLSPYRSHSHLIFSIDPRGCEDVDDALSVRELPNGNLELGVHIADVTHFVKPGSLTDLEARNRSTTVYLADRRYDMLPGVLRYDEGFYAQVHV